MEIYTRLAKICKAVEAIKKEKTNQQQNFKYRGIDQVMNQLHDLFAENEVVITSEVVSTSREERTNAKGTVLIWSIIDYKFVFFASDGSSVQTTVRGEAMDSGDKGSNKCYSVALKYALFGMFLIPTEEMKDPDSETYTIQNDKPQPPAQPQTKQKPVIPQSKLEEAKTYLRGTFPQLINQKNYLTAVDVLQAVKAGYELTEAQIAELTEIINQPK